MNTKIRQFTFDELENFIKSSEVLIADHFKDAQNNNESVGWSHMYICDISTEGSFADEIKSITKNFLSGTLDELSKEIIAIFDRKSCEKGFEFPFWDCEEYGIELIDYGYIVLLYNALKSKYLKAMKWDIEHFWNAIEYNRKNWQSGNYFISI